MKFFAKKARKAPKKDRVAASDEAPAESAPKKPSAFEGWLTKYLRALDAVGKGTQRS